MKYSDEEIVKEVLAGEKHLFGLLIDRYQRPVYNLMLRYAGNSDEAADLTQDAFVRSFERLRLFCGDRTFFPWMYSLAINLAKDWSRKKSRQRAKMYLLQQQATELQDDSEGNGDRETRQEIEQVEDSLMQLSSETREILILRYRHGRPIQDVAGAFNLSESATKMRIKRGLAQLREILLDKEG
jgi:RNA polymerase sigma-70 factor (ECF subfamily)